jgi:hypothetical protein
MLVFAGYFSAFYIKSLGFLFLLFLVFLPGVTHAAENFESRELTRSELIGVAKDFVNLIEKGFGKADSYFQRNRDRNTLLDSDVGIPDGELLLLTPRIGEKQLLLKSDIIAIKQGNDAFISLRDLFAAAGFAIVVDSNNGTAKGWYIRKSQTFDLNVDEARVVVNGNEFVLNQSDLKIEQDDIYVLGAALGEWFGAVFWPRFSSQYLDVSFDQRWPIEEKLLRRKRRLAERQIQPPPKEPRIDKPYETVSIPNAAFTLNHYYRDPGNKNKSSSRTRYSALASGDVAKLTGEAFVSGDVKEGIENVRLKFSRDSDTPSLLGPLNARRFEVGDISTVRLPLAGNAAQELGIRVTNKETNAPPQYSTTRFTGNLEPDWDVELFRNGHLVAFQTVDDNGLYEFNDVDLFIGNNLFKIVMYGPQGEIQEKEENIIVDPKRVAESEGIYDVSLSLSGEQTYRRLDFEDADKGEPHLTASYQKNLSRNLSVNAGFRARSEEAQDKLYVQGGVSTTLAGALIDADLAADVDGEVAAEIVGRKKIKRHDLKASIRANSDEYDPGQRQSDPRVLAASASMKGPVLSSIPNTSYTLNTRYQEQASGASRYDVDAGIATKINKLRYNKNFSYDHRDRELGTDERFHGSFGVRGNYNKYRWRTRANYEISPETEVESLLFDLSRKVSKQLSARFELERNLDPGVTEGRVSANYVTDKFVVSPKLEMNTEEEVVASVNMRLGLTREPRTGELVMTSKPVSQRGGVSAKVYLDLDGNEIFSEGDELLEGVNVKSLHTHGQAFTNEEGIAFIYDLQSNRLTDIVIDEQSFEDPFWISAKSGVSVRARPGATTEVEFPIHVSGEVDGTVYLTNDKGDSRPAKGVRLSLYDMQGNVVKESAAAFDGFYIFSQIKPGKYFIVINEDDIKALGGSSPLPKIVEFAPNGTIIYANNLYIPTENEVPYLVASDYTHYLERNPSLDPAIFAGDDVILNLGSYNSRLLMAVVWYRMKSRYGAILNYDSILVPPSKSFVSLKSLQHTLRVRLSNASIEEAKNKCRALIARNFYCSIEINPSVLAAQQINVASKK